MSEQISLEWFSDEDFLEVFIRSFRRWLDTKIGAKSLELPFSYLLKKYSNDFLNFALGPDHDLPGERGINSSYDMVWAGRRLVQKGIEKMPSMVPNEKITEKFKKHIAQFVSWLELPDYVKVELKEDIPFDIKVHMTIDYPKMLQDSSPTSVNIRWVVRNLSNSIENVMGIPLGNPNFGELNIDSDGEKFEGLDEWVKNVLNQKIKKWMKEHPWGKNNIHSIKFEPKSTYGAITITMKRHANWSGKAKFKEDAENYLESLGYPQFRLKLGY